MTSSYNATFVGESPVDAELSHPPGAASAKALKTELTARGFGPYEMDNWRDCGWYLNCEFRGAKLAITFAATAIESPRTWMLQICEVDPPGLLSRLLGRADTDHSLACYELACAVQLAFRGLGFDEFRWRLDGPPEAGDPSEPPRK